MLRTLTYRIKIAKISQMVSQQNTTANCAPGSDAIPQAAKIAKHVNANTVINHMFQLIS
ncbi:hypothetical protein IKS57_03935 [bacterium]|nr:hypothetical protein [bacterium]